MHSQNSSLELSVDDVNKVDLHHIKSSSSRCAKALSFSDCLAWLLAFGIGLLVLVLRPSFSVANFKGWWLDTGLEQFVGFMVFAGVSLYNCWKHGHYHKRSPFWSEMGEIARNISSLGLLNGVFVLIGDINFSKTVWLASFTSLYVLLPLNRLITRKCLLRSGHWLRPTIIIGTGHLAATAYCALHSEPQLGFEVQAFIHPEDPSSSHEEQELNLPVLKWSYADLQQNISLLKNYHVVLASTPWETGNDVRWYEFLSQHIHDLHVVPPIMALPLVSMEPQHFFSHDILLLRSRNNLLDNNAIRLKRFIDIVGSGLLLIILAPLFLILMGFVRLSGGDVFFGQPRIGKDGKPFTCYKFRTMHPDAEERLTKLLMQDSNLAQEWEAFRKLKNDPRVTPIGQLLRKTSLDELPQLLNVLKGEMSLVGPRPRLLDEPACFYYKAARPGITGLWQVSGRNQLSYEDRISMDVWYIKNWSIWYDLAILCKTTKVVLFREGAY